MAVTALTGFLQKCTVVFLVCAWAVAPSWAVDQTLPGGTVDQTVIVGPANVVTSNPANTAVVAGGDLTIKAGKVGISHGLSVASGAAFKIQLVPYFPQAPTATPDHAAGTAALSVERVIWIGGEANVTYTWSKVSGPGNVTFSSNGSHAALDPTATFSAVGAYVLQVTAAAPGNIANHYDLPVTIDAINTALALSPKSASVQVDKIQAFTPTMADQFGAPIVPQPAAGAYTWTVTGGGTITAGIFTATTIGGPFTVTAISGSVEGVASIVIQGTTAPPTPPIDWESDLTVEANFVAYKTGSDDETIDGVKIHYTNSKEPVGVSVSASSESGATITKVVIDLSGQRQENPGPSGTKYFSVGEGVHDLTVTIVAQKDAQAGEWLVDLKKRLHVDRTKPVIRAILPKRFWPEEADREPGVLEYPLVRLDDNHIWINKEGETWNRTWRTKLTRQFFGKDDVALGLLMAVSDATGLDKRLPDVPVQVKARDELGTLRTLENHAILDKDSSGEEDKPEPGQSSTPQRVKVMQVDTLPDSFPKNYSIPRPGRHLLLVSMKDKAGNELVDEPLVSISKDTDLPRTNFPQNSFQTAPYRFLAALYADEACQLVWQGGTANVQTLLRPRSADELGDGGPPMGWRLNQVPDVNLPSDSQRPDYPFAWHTGSTQIIFADVAGNRANASATTFTLQTWTVGEGWGSQSIGIPSGMYDRDRTLIDKFVFYDPMWDKESTGPMSHAFSSESSVFSKVGRIKKDQDGWPVYPYEWTWTFKEYDSFADFRAKELSSSGDYLDRVSPAVPVVPLDPEAKSGSSHKYLVRPSVITIAPSWKPKDTLGEGDKIRVAVIDRPERLTSQGGEIRWAGITDPADVADAEAYTDPTQSSVKGISRKVLPAREDTRPGFARLQYQYFVGSGSSSFSAATTSADADGGAAFYEQQTAQIESTSLLASSVSGTPDYGNEAAYWLNAIKVSPDIVSTGTQTMIRLEAGFFTDQIRPDSFARTGDYVRFLDGSNDLTITVADYPTATAEELKGKIAIVSQRMLFPDGNIWQRQQLELNILIGANVPASALHVDVKLGAVRFDDPTPGFEQANASNPDPNKGENGAHRMTKSLSVISFNFVTVKGDYYLDGAEEVYDGVLTTSVSKPQVVINQEDLRDAKYSKEYTTFRVRGYILDPLLDNAKPGSEGEIRSISMTGIGEAEVKRVSDMPPAGYFRQHPFRGEFDFGTVSIPNGNGNIMKYALETSANPVGDVGRAEISVAYGYRVLNSENQL